jgi:excisionase family DNA binding protein
VPALLDRPHTRKPSPADQKAASLLAHLLEGTEITPEMEPVRAEITALLRDLGRGQGFAILAVDRDLTPTQAAKLLGVSRTHFMRILQNGDIPYRMVGAHHRVRLDDLLKYREERERRGKALDELVAQAQELDMGY